MFASEYFCTAVTRSRPACLRVTTRLRPHNVFLVRKTSSNMSVLNGNVYDVASAALDSRGYESLALSPRLYRLRHEIDVFVKALKLIRNYKSTENYNSKLLSLYNEDPSNIDALYLLLHGNSHNFQFIDQLYQKAKSSTKPTEEVVALTYSLFIQNNGFLEAYKIYQEYPKLFSMLDIAKLIPLAPSLESVRSIWTPLNELNMKIPIKVQICYVRALARLDYWEARSFVVKLKPFDSRCWDPLFEVQGNLRSVEGINNLVSAVVAHDLPINRLYRTIFIAIAKCFPEKTLAICMRSTPLPCLDPEATKLLDLMNLSTIEEMKKADICPRSIWEIPLTGFLYNEKYKEADSLLKYATKQPWMFVKQLLRMYIDCLVGRGLFEKTLSLLDQIDRENIPKDFTHNRYTKLLNFVTKEQMKEEIKIVKREMKERGLSLSTVKNSKKENKVNVEQTIQ
ncbi:hypothetical protein NEOLI_001812 [Neolecta irregularis DAH-3]|uniref:Uncharacterized protein n=1 Tax=Neolecta irregularis (strain DAH-3) TaxID=1198029 RepID=A0A1U7LPI7_NEOID|nr:hypothetical protein NEOLI_001812 [Neolecta irregularis DAH-3]|eukprot:OLL24549.1 hypothetical protein NEOLI_001812 [Neolecta irregularis DAH-3]